jgi:hypothetical protein
MKYLYNTDQLIDTPANLHFLQRPPGMLNMTIKKYLGKNPDAPSNGNGPTALVSLLAISKAVVSTVEPRNVFRHIP